HAGTSPARFGTFFGSGCCRPASRRRATASSSAARGRSTSPRGAASSTASSNGGSWGRSFFTAGVPPFLAPGLFLLRSNLALVAQSQQAAQQRALARELREARAHRVGAWYTVDQGQVFEVWHTGLRLFNRRPFCRVISHVLSHEVGFLQIRPVFF